MAVFNGAEFVEMQIESILSQLDQSDELIISDNGSTDGTLEILSNWMDPRILILENNTEKSPIKNFEYALKYTSKELIFLADQDDVWLPEKLAICKTLLSSYDLIVTDACIVDKSLKTIHESYFAHQDSGPGFIKNILHNKYLGCCMAFRKRCLVLALPFPKDIPMHDIWIGFVAEALRLKTCFYEKPLILYRRHEKNSSTASEPSNSVLFTKLRFRINLIKYIPLLFVRYLRLKYFGEIKPKAKT